ncbi:MAG: PAS domain-containing protein, partial [Gemmatimonadetes bacterium]|nr:PAS domain-containing protein [Gemmatimonadota bacterium]
GFSFWYTHLARRTPGRAYLCAQVVFDVFMVAVVVHLTGGKDSSFAPLYVLAIFAGAVLLPIVGGMLIAVLACVLYFSDVVWSANALDAAVFMQILIFAAVALVTGYLGDRLRRTGVALGEVETELRLLRLDTDDILASIHTGILTVNGYGRLVYMNPTASELLDLSPRTLLGQPVLAELDAAAPGLGALIAGSVRDRAGVRRSQTGEGRDGMVLGVSTTVVERPEPEPPSVTAIFQDITGSRRMEALRRRAERLEAVAELSASLAHEIKNPLASIRSATEQLAGEGVDPEDRGILSNLVTRESDRLSRLLTEFIDFARVKLRASAPLRVGTLMGHAVEVVRAHPDASGRTIRLETAPAAMEAEVRGDEDLLHRAFLNLVLNAAQWAGPSGTVEVEADVVESDLLSTALSTTRAVRIRVTDTGPGVPAGDAEHVFDPFFTLRPGGTGLGLALVQRAAEAHGGAVFVDEPRGEGWGATFTMYLPALDGSEAGE